MIFLFFWFLSSSSRTRARAVSSLGVWELMPLAMMMICRTLISQTSNSSKGSFQKLLSGFFPLRGVPGAIFILDDLVFIFCVFCILCIFCIFLCNVHILKLCILAYFSTVGQQGVVAIFQTLIWKFYILAV